jgi:O-antigen/teichoic acid export membrane protein
MRVKVLYSGISAGLCVALNLALLPTLGTIGGVIAAIAAESSLLLLFLYGVRRHVPAVDPRMALSLRSLKEGLQAVRGQ